MKLKEMVRGIPYIVIKGGMTLFVGDHVRRTNDNAIVCSEAGGWLIYEQWKHLRNEVEVDVEGLQIRREKHLNAIKEIDKILLGAERRR